MEFQDNEKIKLYHISNDYNNTIQNFIPRIPTNRCNGEDDKIDRICTSTAIDGCLLGSPLVAYDVIDYAEMEYACPYHSMSRMVTLMDHNEQTGWLLKAYEFEIERHKVITTEELLKENLVPDAGTTKEHWILENTHATRTFYVFVLSGSNIGNSNTKFDYRIIENNELGYIKNTLDYFTEQKEQTSIII